MKAFFDNLDAQLLEQVKGFKQRVRGRDTLDAPDAVAEVAIDESEAGHPVFLLVGSLSGCTYKDADGYARGMAETYIKSPLLGRVHIHEDKANRRFIYEIHEGGPQRSIIAKVIAELEQDKKVGIHLANDATLVIEEANNEIFSLIYPGEGEGSQTRLLNSEEQDQLLEIKSVAAYCSDTPLQELFPQKHMLRKVGVYGLTASAAAFGLLGLLYSVMSSGVLDGDIFARQARKGLLAAAVDNPVWQLEQARQAAEPQGRSLQALKKESGNWSWDLSDPVAEGTVPVGNATTPPIPGAPTDATPSQLQP